MRIALAVMYALFSFGFAAATFSSMERSETNWGISVLVGVTWPLWLGYAAAVHAFPKESQSPQPLSEEVK